MNTQKNITSFFKRTTVSNTNATIGNEGNPSRVSHNDHHDEGPSKVPEIDLSNVDTINLERDLGLRPPMWFYPPKKRDEVRRAYLKMKPYQPLLQSYPFDKSDSKTRQKPNPRTDTFTTKGFKSCKKVNDGKRCAFLAHIGEGPYSPHNNAIQVNKDLLNQKGHIPHAFEEQSEEQIKRNRLRLETSIRVIRLLTLQACPLRGHDEESENQHNFLEVRNSFAEINDDIAKAIESAPYNA
ncbi:unnamed protein product [Amaranthus hypochondriacus]